MELATLGSQFVLFALSVWLVSYWLPNVQSARDENRETIRRREDWEQEERRWHRESLLNALSRSLLRFDEAETAIASAMTHRDRLFRRCSPQTSNADCHQFYAEHREAMYSDLGRLRAPVEEGFSTLLQALVTAQLPAERRAALETGWSNASDSMQSIFKLITHLEVRASGADEVSAKCPDRMNCDAGKRRRAYACLQAACAKALECVLRGTRADARREVNVRLEELFAQRGNGPGVGGNLTQFIQTVQPAQIRLDRASCSSELQSVCFAPEAATATDEWEKNVEHRFEEIVAKGCQR